MTTGADQTTDALIRSIAGRRPIKVWSWLTTVFGDLARESGAEISGAVLGALTTGIGIRPEATRVALHRLKKEGWIVSRRVGRASRYRLSEHGLAETLHASTRIYAPPARPVPVWHLVMTDPAGGGVAIDTPSHSIVIAPHTMLCMGGAKGAGEGGALIADIAVETIPDWMIRAAIAPEVEAGYRALSALLDEIERAVAASAPPGPLDAALLRLLTLHHWRRALLRHSVALGALCEGHWIGTDCRRRSHALLDHLARPSVDDLAEAMVEGDV